VVAPIGAKSQEEGVVSAGVMLSRSGVSPE
jgi:hypothetical protein